MSAPIRLLGLDLGQKTIGVALSDELGWTAQPVTTIRRAGLTADLQELRRMVQEHGVTEFVLGYPLNMNGTAGPAARAAEEFAAALREATGLPVHLWDERLSTVAAERVLLEADLSRRRRRQVIDRAAAAFVLQGFLNGRARQQREREDA
jgi:putative Holliday junction resolvase